MNTVLFNEMLFRLSMNKTPDVLKLVLHLATPMCYWGKQSLEVPVNQNRSASHTEKCPYRDLYRC